MTAGYPVPQSSARKYLSRGNTKVMLTTIVVVLEMVTTASPAFTSPPSTRVQETMEPSMGATAFKAAISA